MANSMRKQSRSEVATKKAVADDQLKSVTIELPSRGVPYGKRMPEGKYRIRPPRITETKYLAQIREDPNAFNDMLTTILRFISVDMDIDPIDLTKGDRSYLFLWVRAQIHPHYLIKVMCPLCQHVHERHEFLIESIPLKAMPDKYTTELVDYELEKSGQVVSVKAEVHKEVEAAEAFKKTLSGEDQWLVDCTSHVRAVDGQPLLTPQKRLDWIQTKCAVGEDVILFKLRAWFDHGPDYTNCPLHCSNCGGDSTFVLPFRRELYFPTDVFDRDFGNAVHSGQLAGRESGTGVPGVGSDGDSGVPMVAG